MNILWKIEELMHFKWKSKFDHYDPKWPQVDIWPHDICSGSQADEHVWVLWSCYVTWTNWSIFKWKWPFDPCDPKWPQIDTWLHNIGRGSQADQPVWVLWSCCVTWTSYSIFSEKDLLTPVTPNDPRLTSDPITKVEGLKLINMYESYSHAM